MKSNMPPRSGGNERDASTNMIVARGNCRPTSGYPISKTNPSMIRMMEPTYSNFQGISALNRTKSAGKSKCPSRYSPPPSPMPDAIPNHIQNTAHSVTKPLPMVLPMRRVDAVAVGSIRNSPVSTWMSWKNASRNRQRCILTSVKIRMVHG